MDRCANLVETMRLRLLFGALFGIFFLVQYSSILSSLFVPTKCEVRTSIYGFDSSRSVVNSKDQLYILSSSPSFVSKENDSITIDDFDGKDSSTSLDDSLNDGIDPEDEFNSSEMVHNSVVEKIVGVNRFPIEKNGKDYQGSQEILASEIWNNNGSVPVEENLTTIQPKIMSITQMKDALLQSQSFYQSLKPKWPSIVDQELFHAKTLIMNASTIERDPQLDVSLYRNFSEFKRSYELMEQMLKVYIYRDGSRPIFHQPPLKGIYASEGWFMKLLKSSKRFVTKDSNKAHLFYLPFSSRNLEALHVPGSHSLDKLIEPLSSFIELISAKYSFWNRTVGADHFLVSCHDWAPAETREKMRNCIRALCNADVKEGFQFGKDASLPETYIRTPRNPLRQLGGKSPSQRDILAFFAGNMHGYLRPILLKHWLNKDPDMKIFSQIRKSKGKMSYAEYMKSSKYCICAKGYEVNSPRVVESIFFECVPVIISDYFVPPFFESLNWESFAVFVSEKDIPNLKNILKSIPESRYLEMQQRVKMVQKHFLWHSKPVKYDGFHMILHSVWYNRVFQTRDW